MGKLYVVPTPIGNLKDITLRALDVLKEVDLILSEDTRVTRKLLSHYGISKDLQSHHQANEHKNVERILELFELGKNIALVSDAGTPAISDPGYILVRACIENDIEVDCLPGATAIIPALVNSGLPPNRFYYEGFLPHKKGRKTRLEFIGNFPETVVLYESPHRILKCLAQLIEVCGADRRVSVSREITKMYEETKRGTLAEVLAYFEEKGIKGEFVIVLEGKP